MKTKTVLFPYLTENIRNGWDSNIVFTNYGNSDSRVFIAYYGERTKKWRSLLVPGKSFEVFNIDGNEKAFCVAFMSENVYPSGLVFGSGMSFSDINQVMPIPEDTTQKTLLASWELWQFAGQPSCNRLQKRYEDRLKIAAMHAHFVDESRSRLVIYDACPLSGFCPKHPPGAHTYKCNVVDLKYYPKDDGSLDVERQFVLFDTLVQFGDPVYFRSHSDIIAQMKAGISPDHFARISTRLLADDNPEYNHQFHVHIEWRE